MGNMFINGQSLYHLLQSGETAESLKRDFELSLKTAEKRIEKEKTEKEAQEKEKQAKEAELKKAYDEAIEKLLVYLSYISKDKISEQEVKSFLSRAVRDIKFSKNQDKTLGEFLNLFFNV